MKSNLACAWFNKDWSIENTLRHDFLVPIIKQRKKKIRTFIHSTSYEFDAHNFRIIVELVLEDMCKNRGVTISTSFFIYEY